MSTKTAPELPQPPAAPQPSDTPPHGGRWKWNPTDGWVQMPEQE